MYDCPFGQKVITCELPSSQGPGVYVCVCL